MWEVIGDKSVYLTFCVCVCVCVFSWNKKMAARIHGVEKLKKILPLPVLLKVRRREIG